MHAAAATRESGREADVQRLLDEGVDADLGDETWNAVARASVALADTPLDFGADDIAHPSVNYLHHKAHPVYLGGPIKGIQAPVHYDFRGRRNTPNELRAYFRKLGWRRHEVGLEFVDVSVAIELDACGHWRWISCVATTRRSRYSSPHANNRCHSHANDAD